MKRHSTSKQENAVRRDLDALSRMAQDTEPSNGDDQHPPIKVHRHGNSSKTLHKIFRRPSPERAPFARAEMTLEKYRSLKKEDFKNPEDEDTRKKILQLIKLKPEVWKKKYDKVSDEKWEEVGAEYFRRTGDLCEAIHIKRIWIWATRKLRKMLKSSIMARESDDQEEERLSKWPLYNHICFYREITEKKEDNWKRVRDRLQDADAHANRAVVLDNQVNQRGDQRPVAAAAAPLDRRETFRIHEAELRERIKSFRPLKDISSYYPDFDDKIIEDEEQVDVQKVPEDGERAADWIGVDAAVDVDVQVAVSSAAVIPATPVVSELGQAENHSPDIIFLEQTNKHPGDDMTRYPNAHLVDLKQELDEIQDQDDLEEGPTPPELGRVSLPAPRADLHITLEEYQKIEKEEKRRFEKCYDDKTKKVFLALIEQTPTMWRGEAVITLQWEKFAVEFYIRTGVLMNVKSFRTIWKNLKREMTKQLKKAILADYTDQRIEQELRKWKFFKAMEFCYPILKNQEEEKLREEVEEQARNQVTVHNGIILTRTRRGTGRFPKQLVRTEAVDEHWIEEEVDVKPNRSLLDTARPGTSDTVVYRQNLQDDPDVIEFTPSPTPPDHAAEAEFARDRLHELAEIPGENAQLGMRAVLENISSEGLQMIREKLAKQMEVVESMQREQARRM